MTAAIAYARVSSREQEREGYSIPAQRKLLSGYARTKGYSTKHEFIDVESAKNPGRKEFMKMLRLLETDDACRVVLVEKTDRLYRNRADALAFEALIEKRNVEIHLVKEGRVISKESRSQDKFMHDIHVAVAKHYVENLKEEVKKGMREKAEQGIYPSRAPIGYRNNPATRSIDVDPERAPMVRRIFELYATGEHSLTTLRKTILNELGLRLARSYFETILRNRFYLGCFVWQGIEYKGTHQPQQTRTRASGVSAYSDPPGRRSLVQPDERCDTGDQEMSTPTFIHLCWICGLRVDIATCKIDEYGEAVHEDCYVARVALENAARKGPVFSKTAAHPTGSEPINRQLP